MAFFSIAGNHHDLALVETERRGARCARGGAGSCASRAEDRQTASTICGRRRSGWKQRAFTSSGRSTTELSQSLYILDPDGNRIELYVDGDPRIWRDDPSAVAHSEPFAL